MKKAKAKVKRIQNAVNKEINTQRGSIYPSSNMNMTSRTLKQPSTKIRRVASS